MASEKSFTFKKQTLEDAGAPLSVLSEQKKEYNETEKMSSSSSSSLGSSHGKERTKASSSASSKRKLDRENDPAGGKGEKKKEKRAKKSSGKSDAEDEGEDESLPVARRIKEIGSGKVVDGRVKNIRGISQPIEEMVDSSDLFKKKDFAGLYGRYSEEGYIFLRDVLPRAEVQKAYKRILQQLKKTGAADESGKMKTGQSKGWAVQASTGELVSGKNPHAKGSAEAEAYVESWRTACLDKAVQQVLNGEALTKVVEALCRGRQAALKLPEAKPAYRPLVLNPFFTWLRVKGHKDTTIEHADYFYWLRETDLFISVGDATMYNVEGEEEESLDPSDIECVVCKSTEDEEGNEILLCEECDYGIHLKCKKPPLKHLPKGSFFCPGCHPRPMMGTAYIPFQDMGPNHSVPCVLPGSHRFSAYDKTLRSDGDVPAAFYKDEGRRKPWHVPSSYRAGDVLLLDLRVVQAGTRNQTESFGVSCDTRFYLKPERDNWGKTPCTRFVKAAAENRLVWKGERVKDFGDKAVTVDEDDDDDEMDVEEVEGSEESEEEEEQAKVEEEKPKAKKQKTQQQQEEEKKEQAPPPPKEPEQQAEKEKEGDEKEGEGEEEGRDEMEVTEEEATEGSVNTKEPEEPGEEEEEEKGDEEEEKGGEENHDDEEEEQQEQEQEAAEVETEPEVVAVKEGEGGKAEEANEEEAEAADAEQMTGGVEMEVEVEEVEVVVGAQEEVQVVENDDDDDVEVVEEKRGGMATPPVSEEGASEEDDDVLVVEDTEAS